MKTFLTGIAFLYVGSILLFAGENPPVYNNNWPQWRGPNATGMALQGNPPIEWSESKNIKWKIEIPGKCHATPIVWGDQLFILSAVETNKKTVSSDNTQQQGGYPGMPTAKSKNVHEFVVIAVNRQNGKLLWTRTVKEEMPEEGTHEFGSWASNSPVTDGEYIYAYFGSRGLYCLDMQGNIKWERDFGQMVKRMSFGEGSSPALYDDKIVIIWDHEEQSFIVTLDKQTGETVWKVDRDEISSWSTPLIVEVDGKTQVITSAARKIRSYDLETGELIWECSGMTENVIPHPVTVNGIVYLTSGYRGNALLAIDLKKAKGNITNADAIVWEHDQDTPYTPSPLLSNNMIYLLRENTGALSCLDARDGRVYYNRERLEGTGNVFASPTGVQDRLYIVGSSGVAYVVKQGPQFEILATNSLDDSFHASPVIVGNDLYLRGFKYLYCISEE
ncbi:PQQ-like beta-propeller repeat protein [bacterium]|nr:PQQ-like beta-propeller repeat protein [bacterium]RQV93318.1 MAG: hypothetical protein EH221_10140 [bacterium]